MWRKVSKNQEFFKEFAVYLKANIEQRFGNEIKHAYMCILNVDFIRKLPEEEVRAYGVLELDKLIDFYGFEQVGKNDCLQLNQSQLIAHMSKTNDERFDCILFLLGAAEIIPMSTACCERGFSEVNNTKTDLRNLLGKEISIINANFFNRRGGARSASSSIIKRKMYIRC
jgi:hypothetical protein